MALTSMVQEVGSLRVRFGVGVENDKIEFLVGTSYSVVQTLLLQKVSFSQGTASQADDRHMSVLCQ